MFYICHFSVRDQSLLILVKSITFCRYISHFAMPFSDFTIFGGNVSINSMAAHPPPRAFVGHLSFWRKNVANAPPWGPNNATKSPPLGTYIDTNAPPLGTKYKFSEDF